MGWNIKGNLSGERLCEQLIYDPKGSGMKSTNKHCAKNEDVLFNPVNPDSKPSVRLNLY